MNINDVILLTFEEKGYAGVEMFNQRYPSSQINNGAQGQIKVRKEGDPAIATGTDQSSFAKNDSPKQTMEGKPVIGMMGGKDPVYSHAQNLVKSMEGKPVIATGGPSDRAGDF